MVIGALTIDRDVDFSLERVNVECLTDGNEVEFFGLGELSGEVDAAM